MSNRGQAVITSIAFASSASTRSTRGFTSATSSATEQDSKQRPWENQNTQEVRNIFLPLIIYFDMKGESWTLAAGK
jgi:hypothetical protein